MAQNKEVFNLEYRFGGNAEFLTRIEQSLTKLDKGFTATKVESSKLGDTMAKSMSKASVSVDKLGNSFSSLTGKVKGFIAAYAGIAGLSRAVSFGMGSMALADIQSRTEKQLQLVMDNMGTGKFFEDIKKEASAIQGRTIYGDEAMIAGAGELATYVKDPRAMKRMMNVLADYAAGMTGGGEVGAQQMVQLATGLGMAFDGNYRALRMKGFDTSALEKLDTRNNVTEAERVEALAKSLETWKGLSSKMAEDPSAAAIKLKNKIGDLREELGKRLYPVYNKMISALDKNLPNIEKMMDSIGKVSGKLFDAVSNNVDSVMKFGEGVGRLVEKVINLVDVGAPVVGKLMEIPGLVEAVMTALAVEKLNGISGGLGRIAGGFHGIEKALRRTNRELLTMGRNGKMAAMGIAAAAGGSVAGFMGGAESSGGVLAGGLATGASTLAMTGSPFLALAATGGSFVGSAANAFSKWIGSDKDAAARIRAIEEQGEYNMMLASSYRNLEKAKKNRKKDGAYYALSLKAFQDSMAKYSAKYGEDAAMSLYEGISGTASKDARSSTTNNFVTNNNSVTQNNTIGAEFSKLGNLINQKLVELMERNLSFDTSMVMEVAGA